MIKLKLRMMITKLELFYEIKEDTHTIFTLSYGGRAILFTNGINYWLSDECIHNFEFRDNTYSIPPDGADFYNITSDEFDYIVNNFNFRRQ